MKKYFISAVLGIVLVAGMTSCFHHHDMSVTVSDDDYDMEELYNKKKSHTVQVYVDDKLINNSVISFKNDRDDDEITLDDNATIHINSNRGELRIKIDDRKNSKQVCVEMNELCEELKDIFEHN